MALDLGLLARETFSCPSSNIGCTINQVEQELKKEGKLPSFKGSGLQEVIPDWLMKSKKRELQSCSGMFRKRIEGG